MTKIDDDLRARLSAADEEFLADLENGDGFFTQLFATLKGPQGWIGIMILAVAFTLVALSAWFVWEAFHAENVKHTVLWMGGGIGGLIGQGILRLFLTSRMHMLAMMRELKRIELRLVKLDERLV